MPIRSGAMQRPRGCRCGNTLRQRYEEVGLPCSSTMGSPSPTSTYAISRPRTRRRCLWYGNAAEIMLASPPFFHSRDGVSEAGFERGGARDVVAGGALREAAAHHHVLDFGGVDAGALDRMTEHVRLHRD